MNSEQAYLSRLRWKNGWPFPRLEPVQPPRPTASSCNLGSTWAFIPTSLLDRKDKVSIYKCRCSLYTFNYMPDGDNIHHYLTQLLSKLYISVINDRRTTSWYAPAFLEPRHSSHCDHRHSTSTSGSAPARSHHQRDPHCQRCQSQQHEKQGHW